MLLTRTLLQECSPTDSRTHMYTGQTGNVERMTHVSNGACDKCRPCNEDCSTTVADKSQLLPCDRNRMTVTFTGKSSEFVTFRFTLAADDRQLLLGQYAMCYGELDVSSPAMGDLFE